MQGNYSYIGQNIMKRSAKCTCMKNTSLYNNYICTMIYVSNSEVYTCTYNPNTCVSVDLHCKCEWESINLKNLTVELLCGVICMIQNSDKSLTGF